MITSHQSASGSNTVSWPAQQLMYSSSSGTESRSSIGSALHAAGDLAGQGAVVDDEDPQAAQEHCPGGYRMISNSGYDGMQSQSHAHVHILGGQFLGEYA